MHRLLERQLRKLGLEPGKVPDKQDWQQLLLRVSDTYRQSDDDRYTLERSLQISSDEMQELFQRQKASTEGRLQALIDAIPDLVFMLDEDGRYLEVIAGDNENLFLPAEQVRGKLLHDIIPREHALMFMDSIRRALDDNRLQLLTYSLTVQAGDKVFEARVVPTGLKVKDRHTVLFLARDITELSRSQDQLQHNATHDALTGLPNRLLLDDRLRQAISRSQRINKKAAIMLMDLDRFKHINDSLGHNVGDKLLQQVADRLCSSQRVEDSVFRFGGDEFVVILEDLNSVADAGKVADKILNGFSQPIHIGDMELEITSSVGIAITPDDSDDADTLLRQADNAMYAAKDAGRNQFCFYTAELGERSMAYLAMESSLRKAILNQEMELHYQPQYQLDNRQLSGLEALVRWPSADKNHRMPDQFIPIAEMSGLIEPLGLWVIEQACQQATIWNLQELQFGRIAINLSSRQLNNPALAEQIEKILHRHKMPGHQLEFEITESMIVKEGSTVESNLCRLTELGIELAIDDFGTGHSSLVNLKRLPLKRLKIDRAFVDGLGEDPNDEAITRTSIAMARELGLEVVAEGVETENQVAFLVGQQCHYGQGYLFARPLPLDEIEQLLDSQARPAKKQGVPGK